MQKECIVLSRNMYNVRNSKTKEAVMKKLVMSAVLVGLVMSSGCSMLNYNASKKDYVARVATQRAMASGDQQAIKAVASGNYVGVGIDLLDPNLMDVLSEHPVRATIAALADVAAAAAATYAISGIFNKNETKNTTTTITLNISDGNMINQGNGTISSGHNQPQVGDNNVGGDVQPAGAGGNVGNNTAP